MIRPYPVQRQTLPASCSRIDGFGGCRIAIDEVVDGDDQTGRAEPALHGTGVDEGLLDVGRRARRGHALDRDDGLADDGGRHHEARAHEHVVDEDAARPALALLARALRARQPEPIAQHVEQALAEPRIVDVPVDAVDVEHEVT